jgi:hypothetical protein
VLFCGGRVDRRLGRLGRIELAVTRMVASGPRFRSRHLGGRSKRRPYWKNATAWEIANFKFEISDWGNGKDKCECRSVTAKAGSG